MCIDYVYVHVLFLQGLKIQVEIQMGDLCPRKLYHSIPSLADADHYHALIRAYRHC